MAQTKTRTTRSNSTKSSNSRSTKASSSRGRTTSRNGSSASSRKQSGARSTAAKGRANATKSSGSAKGVASKGASATKGAAESVGDGAKTAAQGVSSVVQKVKVPLVAGGAALAGVAGAAVIASRQNRSRKVLGVKVPKRTGFSMPKTNGLKSDARSLAKTVSEAAARADKFGQRVSKIASSVQSVSETADEAVKKT